MRLIPLIVSDFVAITHRQLKEHFSGRSEYFTLHTPQVESKIKKYFEGFLNIGSREACSYLFETPSFLSLLILSGAIEINCANLQRVQLKSNSEDDHIYLRIDAFQGGIEIINYGFESALLHVVTTRNPKPIFRQVYSSFDQTNAEVKSPASSSFRSENNRTLRIIGDGVVILSNSQIRSLKSLRAFEEKQIRLCSHPSDTSTIQEMFLDFGYGVNFPMMLHRDKSESFILLRGRINYRLLTEPENILNNILMSGLWDLSADEDLPFFIWIGRNLKHSPVVTSENVLAKETTAGPFDPLLTLRFPDPVE